ncbi:MAG: hypothetical protein K2I51_07980 [Muribaculaceae bacterium]|nr:hypothetical protein [Muribaculaceae bacterium]
MPTIARTSSRNTDRREADAPRLSRQSIWRGALHGRVLSLDFMRRNWLLVLAVTTMLMIYITSRYTCQTQMETIQRLERDLEVVKTERIREKSTYMSRIRESQMQHLADSMRLGLTIQEQPPFRLAAGKK